MRVRVSEIQPWWLRLLFLLAIGLPPICGWPLTALGEPDEPIANIAMWLGYACFIWIFVWLNIGGERLMTFLSAAVILALTTTLVGGGLRRLIPALSGGASQEEVSIRMALLFVQMVSIIPYSLFFINSFSVSGVLTRISERASESRRVGRIDTAALHAALSLRVMQHVGEVFTAMLLVWSEENPEKLLPRFRTDWSKTKLGNASYVQWFYRAVVAWCFACLIHTFEAIPFFVDEIKKVKTATWKNVEAS